jgi:hypothetical protein
MSACAFVPIPGVTWDDFLRWTGVSFPGGQSFLINSVGVLKSLVDGKLPEAQIEGGGLHLRWHEGSTIFSIRIFSKAALADNGLADIIWSVKTVEGKVLLEGADQNLNWYPPQFVDSFSKEWRRVHSDGFALLLVGILVSSLSIGYILSSLV